MSSTPNIPLASLNETTTSSSIISHLRARTTEPSSGQHLFVDSETALLLSSDPPPGYLDTIWLHAYRRAEDEMLLLYPASESARSALFECSKQFPGAPAALMVALTALYPLLTHMSPENINTRCHNGLGVSFSLDENGSIMSTRLSLSESCALRTLDPLSLKPGSLARTFNVFYCLLHSQQDRKSALKLKELSDYDLLTASNILELPSWYDTADDESLAKDWWDAFSGAIPAAAARDILLALSGILLLANKSPADRALGASLIGLNPDLAKQYSVDELIAATYLSVVQAVLSLLNVYLANFDVQRFDDSSDAIAVVTIAECTPKDQSILFKNVFDNKYGINLEMASNGISLSSTPASVMKQVARASAQTFKFPVSRNIDLATIVESSISWTQYASNNVRIDYRPLDLEVLVPCNRIWTLINIAIASTAKEDFSRTWNARVVSQQIRDNLISEWVAKRAGTDYTADFGVGDFMSWFSAILPDTGSGYTLDSFARVRGWGPSDFFIGVHRVYLSDPVWQSLEAERQSAEHSLAVTGNDAISVVDSYRPNPFSTPRLGAQTSRASAVRPLQSYYSPSGHLQEMSQVFPENHGDDQSESEFDERDYLTGLQDIEKEGNHLEVQSQTTSRKVWVGVVWMLTFWIPSPLMVWPFGMKRSDVRIAWREKVTIFFFIFLLNAAIIFYMIFLGKLICPDYDKAWNHKELGYHQGTTDFYVGIHGKVYDITEFYTTQHSDNGVSTTSARMLEYAGQDCSDYFPPPLTIACPLLVDDVSVYMTYNTTASPYSIGLHRSGEYLVPSDTTALHQYTWYQGTFEPAIKEYLKGDLVETRKNVKKMTTADPNKYLFILNGKIYDLTNYYLTTSTYPSSDDSSYAKYAFIPSDASKIIKKYQGLDATDAWTALNSTTKQSVEQCLDAAFYYAKVDFRQSAKCQTANIILLVIAGILTSITVIKFVTSIRFGRTPMPSQQDRFVICQIPAYTEGEDDLRLAIDSITALDYNNSRKLMVIICDGEITGAGNDRSTPRIVLDILGVQEHLQAEPKAYHAIAEGSRELNYARVYSGLYECEGKMVPFLVISKCGAPSETQRPGNRGKRDSQILLMNFLNRTHKQAPMCPLDLEIFHHINNIIGVEPERYEYLLTIDADTKVAPDSLTRLVAACTSDYKIAAICGETGIQNEQQSLSTMIQVYEYFISHHLTKSFESLFGSVTCLPGCFSLFRLRTARKSKPLIISDEVIEDYSIRHVDTLHKKNLFSLGEDRYLTTLMAKHFSRMTYKFIPDAKAETRVPEEFSVLMSQRRRWINSTVHNLAELLRLKTMCGFCCFSMRGVVFVDLVSTLMLPSVVVYLVYLIYVIASGSSPLPIISIILIASVYGLQMLVYIFHQRWQHIFWMLIYIAAYPFHSFILPIYSFWNMDNFAWGNTRVVVDESKGKRVVLQDDNDIFDSRSVPFERWESYATREGLPGVERSIVYDSRKGRVEKFVKFTPEPFERGPTGREATKQDSLEPFDQNTLREVHAVVREVLYGIDLETMTSRQLREKVEQHLNMQFSTAQSQALDQIVDEELESLEMETPNDTMEDVLQAYTEDDPDRVNR